MKKRVAAAIMIAGCLAAMPAGVYGEETDVQAAEERAEDVAEEPAVENTALSDNLFDFQIEILGDAYQFPMTYEEFTAKGWTLRTPEDAEEMLSCNSYGSIAFEKGDLTVYGDVVNFQVNQAAVKDCLVAGVSVNEGNSDLDLPGLGVKLAKGITLGVSNVEDIKAAYGEPSDTYEGELYTQMTYEKDIYEEVELSVYKEDNVLREISVRHMTEPEGFDKGSVSGETPEIVTAYTAPEALGADLMDPVVELCGDLYTLPCPITAFEANGWKLDGITEEDFVEGRGIDFITMTRDAQSIDLTVHNLTQNAVTHENCFVTEVEIATYSSANLTLKISGGYTLGAEKADMMAAAEAKGFLCEENDNYLNIYKDEDNKLDTRIQLWFNEDESDTIVAGITYRNEILPE